MWNELKKTLDDNAPLLLSLAGIGGFVVGMVMVSKTAPKARKVYLDIESELPKSPVERFMAIAKTIGPIYAPSVGMALISTAAILGAHRINSKRYTSLAAVYTFTSESLRRWQDATLERVGKNDYEEIEKETVKPRKEPTIVYVEDGTKSHFYDVFSDRFFVMGRVEEIRKIINDLNDELRIDGYKSVNDFYSAVGLKTLDYGDHIGWAMENGSIDIKLIPVLTDDGKLFISVDFVVEPKHILDRLGR